MRSIIFMLAFLVGLAPAANAFERIYLGSKADVVTSRPNDMAFISTGAGADMVVTGITGRDVEVNSGNDHDIDHIYVQSLPGVTQANGKVLPWVGPREPASRGGFFPEVHVYHVGFPDEVRCSFPIWNRTPANGGYAMSPIHVRCDIMVHGPGAGRGVTVKSFDWHGQRIIVDGAARVSEARGIDNRDGTWTVTTFVVRGNSTNPGAANQVVSVDTSFLPPSSELRVKANSAAGLAAAVQAHGRANGWLVGTP